MQKEEVIDICDALSDLNLDESTYLLDLILGTQRLVMYNRVPSVITSLAIIHGTTASTVKRLCIRDLIVEITGAYTIPVSYFETILVHRACGVLLGSGKCTYLVSKNLKVLQGYGFNNEREVEIVSGIAKLLIDVSNGNKVLELIDSDRIHDVVKQLVPNDPTILVGE